MASILLSPVPFAQGNHPRVGRWNSHAVEVDR
jgi:hypothetical protein